MLHDSKLPLVILSSRNTKSNTGQCDCACASPVVELLEQLPLDLSASLKTAPDIKFIQCEESDCFIAYQPGGTGIAVLNLASISLLQAFTDGFQPKKYLLNQVPLENRTHVISTIRELRKCNYLLDEADVDYCQDDEELSAWIHVTNNCNMSCTYCYVQKSPENLGLENGILAIQQLFLSAQTHGFKTVKLKYAGGEPSLNFPLVLLLHEEAKRQSAQTGIALREVIISNGTNLSNKRIRELIDRNIDLSISLDSVTETHNLQRCMANGENSDNLVKDTICRSISLGLRPDICITLSRLNLYSLTDTITWLIEKDLDFSINFYRSNNPTCNFENYRIDPQEAITVLKNIFFLIKRKMPNRSLLSSLLDHVNMTFTHDFPCNAGQSYVVINHKGLLYNCQMHMTVPSGSICGGDLLDQVRSDLNFDNPSVDHKPNCFDCEWKYWCAGGCPLLNSQDSYIKSSYCLIYKNLIPEIIKMEGSRLLENYYRDYLS